MAVALRDKLSWGKALLATVGIGESKGWSTLFLVFTILGLVPNFVLLLGCLVNQTQSLYLFRVSSIDMIDATANLTTVGTASLDIEELPEYWYWGLSGLCAVHRNDEVYCKRAFPPTYTVEEMISFGVASYPDTEEDQVKSIIRPWTTALSQLSSDLATKQSTFISMIRATAALAILSTLLALALAGLAFASLTFLHGKPPRWMLYLGAFVDAGLFTGAGVLAIYAMNNGPRVVIAMSGIDQGNERTFIGPGFFVLFAGALFKLISIGIFFIMAFFVILMGVFLVWCCIASCGGKKEDDDVESDEVPINGPEQKAYV